MNKEQDKQTPYFESLSELIKISTDSLKSINDKIKMIKIRTIIISCGTLILTFTVLKSIIPLSFIASCLINGFEIYKAKKQVNSIKKQKKAIKNINDFLNLETKLVKKNCMSKNIMKNFLTRMKYSNDLYTCFETTDNIFLDGIINQYAKKIESDLTILNKNNDKEAQNQNIKPVSTSTNSLTPNIVNYLSSTEPVKGHQYIKKII